MPKDDLTQPPTNEFQIPGLPTATMNDEDVAMMDEIVTEAMELRRIRWESLLSRTVTPHS